MPFASRPTVRSRPRTAVLLAVICMVAVLATTSCSNRASSINRTPNSGSATASPAGPKGIQQITLQAGDDYRFFPATFTVHPGMVEVVLRNTGNGAPHNFALDGLPGSESADVQAGHVGTTTFMAPSPGTYRFECTIHVNQGQIGTMIVTPG